MKQPWPAWRVATIAAGAALVSMDGARAHGNGNVGWFDLSWSAWSLPLLLPLLLLCALYAAGSIRRFRSPGRGIAQRDAAAFWCAAVLLFAAVFWPLDAWGERSLAAHVAQHMVLLAFAPSLLLAARPLAVVAQLLPPTLLQPLHRVSAEPARAMAGQIAIATVLHAGVMWLWHVPTLLAAALVDDALHWVMHASTLIAGLWYWATIVHCLRQSARSAGIAIVALLVVMMQMGLIGALLTFSPRPLYAIHAEHAVESGLDALLDQQLAGLIMWVPACLPYLLAALFLAARLLGLRPIRG